MKKYAQIDFFRGVAALSVFISHFLAWMPIPASAFHTFKKGFETLMKVFQLPGEGHPGVICFIVLSGFCIHLPYRSKKLEGLQIGKEIRKFFIRRFMRIFPLFMVACMLGIGILFLTLGSSAQTLTEQFSGSRWSDVTFLNVALKLSTLAEWKIIGYGGTYMGNAPLASVITEVWLYLCYPLFFFILRRKGWAPVFAVTMAMYLLFPALYLLRGAAFQYSWWLFSLFNYYILWAWGAWLAEVTFGVITISRSRMYKLLFGSLAAYLLALILARQFHWHFLVYLRMLLLAGSFGALLSIVIRADYRPAALHIPAFLRPAYKALCSVGDFSYSLYAIHAPLIFVALWAMLTQGWNNNLFILYPLLVLSLSLVTYRLIEMPTHQLAKKLTS